MLRSNANVPLLSCCGVDVVVEGVELQQACADSPPDCVAVTRGCLCLRRVVITSLLGSAVVVTGKQVSVRLECCTISHAGKYGCFVTDGASAEALDSVVEDCQAAGVVSRGKGSAFRAERCTIHDNRGNGVGADEGGCANLGDCQLLDNRQCGAMASGLLTCMQFARCIIARNGTHGLAAAGRARISCVDHCQVKSNSALGCLIQSGASAELANVSIKNNGAHGICLQLGGIATILQCKIVKNKQTGLAVMGADSRASAAEITSSDNGIDGCHVGQGAELHLKESVLQNNRRMGLSALGLDTRAVVEGSVMTGSGEHGIAQGQGAQVSVANNTVKDNQGKDTVGHVHAICRSEQLADTAAPPSLAHPHAAGKSKCGQGTSEETPLIGAAAGSGPGPRKRFIRHSVTALVCGLVFLVVLYILSWFRFWRPLVAAAPSAHVRVAANGM